MRFRAGIVLLAADGIGTRDIGRVMGCTTGTVSKWRVRYARDRLAGFNETGGRGAAPKYGSGDQKRILAMLDQAPPTGYSNWTAPLLARALGDVHEQYIWRFLRAQEIDLRAASPGARAPTRSSSPPNQGQASGEPVRGADRPGHALEARHRVRLVWERRAHCGNQQRHRSLAPRRDAHRAHSVGAGSAALLAGSTRKPCSAPIRFRTPCRCCAGSSSVGRRRSRSARCATTLAWKRSVNGRTPPSHALRPACSACSPSSPCWPPNSARKLASPLQPARGIASNAQPSPTRSLRCGGKSGANRVSPRPVEPQTCENFHEPSRTALPTHSATPHDGQSRANPSLSISRCTGSVKIGIHPGQ